VIFLVRLAFRNVLRHPHRSLLSAAPVVAGVAVSILGMGLVGGLDENVIRAQINTSSGHVLLRAPGVSEDGLSHEIDTLQPLPKSLLGRLEGLDWTPRVEFDLRIVGGDGLHSRGGGGLRC
jgi:ABC-type lipoprotein release transport system permease subunit